MRATSINTSTTEQNLNSAIKRLALDAAEYSSRRMHGEITVRLRFVDGVAVQWGLSREETHKTGRETEPTGRPPEVRVVRFNT